MTHLFTIDDTIWDSVDTKAVLDTAADIQKMGLFRLPFPKVDVQVHLNEKATNKILMSNSYNALFKTVVFRFFVHPDNPAMYDFEVKYDREFLTLDQIEYSSGARGLSFEKTKRVLEGVEYLSQAVLTFFIVLLATKNADKVTERIKKHGPKSRKRPRAYDYITTIKIGKITETMRSDGDGQGSVRPHLRRGHIRNQRVGKGLEEVKPIFIPPVFVNADEGWINNQRKEYRIAA